MSSGRIQAVIETKNSPPCVSAIDAEWDRYWSGKRGGGGTLYDWIAAWYRALIIRPALNYFCQKNFPSQGRVLHAGCGSGQVDTALQGRIAITPLDLSRQALGLYRMANSANDRAVQASILALPFADDTFDGIYNLGVMEHFPEQEIRMILGEFARTTKPGARIVLFWPPEFGLSVLVLKFVHFVLNRVLGRNVRLHPDEITRIRSKRHARATCEIAGLKMVDYYFGPKDMFTHSIIVLEKMQ